MIPGAFVATTFRDELELRRAVTSLAKQAKGFAGAGELTSGEREILGGLPGDIPTRSELQALPRENIDEAWRAAQGISTEIGGNVAEQAVSAWLLLQGRTLAQVKAETVEETVKVSAGTARREAEAEDTRIRRFLSGIKRRARRAGALSIYDEELERLEAEHGGDILNVPEQVVRERLAFERIKSIADRKAAAAQKKSERITRRLRNMRLFSSRVSAWISRGCEETTLGPGLCRQVFSNEANRRRRDLLERNGGEMGAIPTDEIRRELGNRELERFIRVTLDRAGDKFSTENLDRPPDDPQDDAPPPKRLQDGFRDAVSKPDPDPVSKPDSELAPPETPLPPPRVAAAASPEPPDEEADEVGVFGMTPFQLVTGAAAVVGAVVAIISLQRSGG